MTGRDGSGDALGTWDSESGADGVAAEQAATPNETTATIAARRRP